MNNKNSYILTLVIGLMAMAFIAASVFAYYPLSITVSPVQPPIVFALGSNSNKPDLGSDKFITVLPGDNSTSASVTIHPTYQTTYYKDVLRIRNVDTKAYSVYLRVETPITNFPSGSVVNLTIYSSGADRATPPIANVSLLSTGTTYIESLSGGGTWEVDVKVYIPEGSSWPSSATARLLLIYTPSGETPP